MYAVGTNGEFYKDSPPTHAYDNWIGHATTIGNSDWASFKFLFFGPGDALYAVDTNGKFYKDSPPTHAYDNWIGRATTIGNSG